MNKFMYFLILLSCYACKMDQTDLPEAVKGFPVDTTITSVFHWPSAIDESSGIIKWKDAIWTHNDSKNEATLFKVNLQDGSLHRTVNLKGVDNKDWEALTQDADYFYIGDYGNNHGDRKDLRILKIAKEDIEKKDNITNIDTITFTYPDQTDFTGPTHQHNYDCEAMIAVGDSLYLFSKNFLDRHSRLYALPKKAGHYKAHLKDRFNVKGNITDAAISDEGIVALSGYYFDKGSFFPFIWLFWDYQEQSFFRGKNRRINWDFQAQIEGICYDQDGYFLLSSEQSRAGKGQLFRFNSSLWLP